MYLRHTTRKKNGKTHVYWQLVRSVRHGRKVEQETVAQLGELDAGGRARAQALARSITGGAVVSSQRPLFDADDSRDAIAINLGQVRLERSQQPPQPHRTEAARCSGHSGDWAAVRALERIARGRAVVPHDGVGGFALGSRQEHLR